MRFDLSPDGLARLLASPALTLLTLAAGAARVGGELDADTLALMSSQVKAGVLEDFSPADSWPVIQQGLMGERPSGMLTVLRECGALAWLLPELDALFGQGQASPDGENVDIGEHQCRVADLLAAQHASLPVRLAGLLYNLGKADSPPQHLPVHYQHVERGLPRIAAIIRRFGLAPDVQALAVLTLRELERVHRAAPMRAGSITALLERVDAFGQLARYQQLLLICRCDYHAYPGNAERAYPKATLLERARQACLSVALGDGQQADPVALHEARALAVATALRSSRWADAAE